MPRIGGGGPPVPPPKTGDAQKTDDANFQKVNEAAAQGTDEARSKEAKKQQAEAKLTGKMREIAKKLKQGGLSEEEATQAFVESVIEERLPLLKRKKKQGDKKGKGDGKDDAPQDDLDLLEEAVSGLIEKDPTLAARLKGLFKRLSESESEPT